MKKKNLPALGLALVLLLVLVMAAAIDYRALNSNQFTTSNIVTIKSGAVMTNIALYGSSTLLGSVVMSGLSEAGTPTFPLFIGPGASIVGWSQNGAVWTNLSASSLSSGTVAESVEPAQQTLTLAADGTNFWWDAGTYPNAILMLTNHAIINLTNSGSAYVRPRVLSVYRSGNGLWTLYRTNASKVVFSSNITGFDIGGVNTNRAWIGFRFFSPSNCWDVVGDNGGFPNP